MENNNNLNILHEEVNNRYRKYVKYTILNKGIDTRDGLKTSQRMVLYAAYKVAKQRVKSARLVGEVISNYWPHGDISIYETISNLVKKGLITGYGEWGDFNYNTEQAAMRYTELKISDLAMDLLFDKHEIECVDYIKNFDSRLDIPVYLPAKLPIALLIGVDTIGIEEFKNISIHRYTYNSVKKTFDNFMNGKKKVELQVYLDEDCIVDKNIIYPRFVEKEDVIEIVANTRKYNYSKILSILKSQGIDAINLSTDKTHIIVKKKKDVDLLSFLNKTLSYSVDFSLSGYGFNKSFDFDIFTSNVDLPTYIELFCMHRKQLNKKVTEYKISLLNNDINFYKLLDANKTNDIVKLHKSVKQVSNMTVGSIVNLINSDLKAKIAELTNEKKKLQQLLKSQKEVVNVRV